MPDQRQKVLLVWDGGWATDLGPSFPIPPQNGTLKIPFLLQADNVIYELDGGPHKIGGSSRFNTTAITGSVTVSGFYDYWRQGTASAEAQRVVAYAGTDLWSDQGTQTFVSILSGLESGKEPCFAVFQDNLLWASTSNVDVPQTYNQTTIANLGGSPPNFAFMVAHKNRMWAAGVATNPSRLYYSNSLDAADWAGGGSIDIDPSDGDRITGIRSHKNELIVLKGPNRLSIHRITGTSPSDFARVPFVTGVGGVNQNSMFTVGDDLVFTDPRGIHSLATTANFGDYLEAFLSRPILTYFQDELNLNQLQTSWGMNYAAKGLAVWTFAKVASTVKNVYLSYDYRFQPGRWMSWGKDVAYVAANCLGLIKRTGAIRLHAGLTTGFIEQLLVADRNLPGTVAYTGSVKTPYLNFGTSAVTKNAEAAYISLLPKGSYKMDVEWLRDSNPAQPAQVSQSAGDTLG